ncbi:MAG: hypothetical protein ACPHID_06575 [Thermoplasmatota archaeon]
MRWAVCLLLLPLAGCIEDSTAPVTDSPPVSWYVYQYPEWDALVGETHGYAVQVTAQEDALVRLEPIGATSATALVGDERFQVTADGFVPLRANQSSLWLIEARGRDGGFDVATHTGAPASWEGPRWQLRPGQGDPIVPGQHVATVTVGLWTNGTSFYTNIPELNEDPDFPAGYDRATFDGTPLPIYVYDQDRTEQPTGSKDTCHFTTITGYNALLKTQVNGGTSVRYLQPEEGYTVAGAEDHFLYGDALVFLNTVTAITGTTGAADNLPAPTGACFDAQNTVDYVTGFAPI